MQPHVQLVPLPDSGDANSELIRVLPIVSPQACLRNFGESISLRVKSGSGVGRECKPGASLSFVDSPVPQGKAGRVDP